MRKRLHFIAVCFFALLIAIFLNPAGISAGAPSPISPGIYYVDINNGNDSNDGSELSPWQTLHYAIQQINNGESSGTYILNVASGIYSSSTGEPESELKITQNNVTIQGAGDGNTLIDEGGWTTGIEIAASNVTIKNLAVKGFSIVGIHIYSGTGNIIEGCEVYENENGIVIDSSSSSNTIRNDCKIYHNGAGIVIDGSDGNEIYGNQASIYDNGYGGTPGIGIWIGYGADNNLIHDNNIYWSGPEEASENPQRAGIVICEAGLGNQIYQNEIHGHSGSGDVGIKVEESSPEISKNKIYDNTKGIYITVVDGSTYSPIIRNNLIYDTTATMENGIEVYAASTGSTASPIIYHNTIDGCTQDGIYIREETIQSAHDIKYNIITNFGQYGINNDLSFPGNPVIEYNDLYGNSTNYNNCSGTNDISLDPSYVGGGDYHLQPGSPCIDAIPTGDPVGMDLVGYDRPKGEGYDMGCYEFGETTIETVDMFLSPITGWYPCPGITITDGNPPTITAANDIRITIPQNLNTTWLVTNWGAITGTGADKIDQDSANVTYDDNNRTLVIDVTTDFDPGDDLDISYICRAETAEGTSSGVTGNIGLSVDGDFTAEVANPYAWTVAVISLSSAANQTFYVGDPSTEISPITVTDDVTNATIKAVQNISLRIPYGFNMEWDTSVTTAIIGGTASSKVNTDVTYSEIDGKNVYAYLDVTEDFLPSESFTVSGLKFTNFSDVSSASHLFLETNWFAAAWDDKTIEILSATQDSDGDGMSDAWENTYGLNPSDDSDASGDLDSDGLSNLQEFNNGTNPSDTDSDGDGYYDGEEVNMGSNPADDSDYPSYSPDTYYVNISSGNDLTGDGSPDYPWKTLHHTMYRVNNGEDSGSYTVKVALGTYSVTNGETDESLTITQDNVKIIGESGSMPILDGTDASTWLTGIEIAASNVTLKNLAVKGFYYLGIGIYIYSGTGNIIQGCDVYENWFGILIDSTSSSNIIWNNCAIYHNEIGGIHIYGSSGNEIYGNEDSIYDNWLYGIYIGDGAENNLVHDNNIYWSGDADHPQFFGIYIYEAGSGNKIYGNKIYNHHYGEESGGCGIYVGGSSPVIKRNEIYDNYLGIGVGDSETADASPSIWTNLIHDTGENKQGYAIHLSSEMYETVSPTIYHNTIDGGTDDGIYIEVGSGGNAAPEIKYNIITNFDGYGINNSGGSPTIEYNDVYANTTGQYGGDTTDQTGTNGNISEDPLYGNYTLQSTSPCIDTIPTDSGDPVEIDFAGYARPRDGGYDMGAYEFVSDITQDFSLPGGSGDVTDYRIFTVPINLETGSALKAQMEEALGTYDKGLWRVFAWDSSSSSYIEMDDPAFDSLEVYPGMAFWIISTGTDTISFSGQPVPDGGYVKATLSPGWHMVGLPWPATSIELDNIAVSDGLNNYWITSDNNTLTQQYVWEYTGTGPHDGYEQLASGSTGEPVKGYWINVEANAPVTLLVPKDNTGGYFEATSHRAVSGASTPTESTEEPPPPPGVSVSFTSTSSDGATLSAEGSCFIATSASGSRLHPLKYRAQLLLLPLIGFSAIMIYVGPMFKVGAFLTLMLAATFIIWRRQKRYM